MIVVEEHYLQKVLDSQVYQTLVTVKLDGRTFAYTNELRLWKEDYLEDLRAQDKRRARDQIMNQIRSTIFPTE